MYHLTATLTTNLGRFLRLSGGLFLSCVLTAGAAAQSRAAQETPSTLRLLSAKQGREITAAALSDEGPARTAQDCSHLVQQVYSAAGYDYPYASSFDLYAGNGNFRRVRHAQAGDLITWPGHVGIVISPSHHTFYSLVRSGLQTEDYFGPYWRSRGTPRFYRYVLSSRSDVQTAKLARPLKPGGSNSSLPSTSHQADTEMYAEAERDTVKETPEDASIRVKVPPPARVPESDAAPEAAPSSMLLTSEQRRPTNQEAADAFAELSRSAATALNAEEPLRASIPVVILDEYRIERVETKRNTGWLHVQVESHARLGNEGVDFKHRREKLRWELKRDASGWQVMPPQDKIYVGRDDAVRVLAAQLAAMTQSEAAAKHDEVVLGQEARLAKLLSALLQK